jgi:hypothetical protein
MVFHPETGNDDTTSGGTGGPIYPRSRVIPVLAFNGSTAKQQERQQRRRPGGSDNNYNDSDTDDGETSKPTTAATTTTTMLPPDYAMIELNGELIAPVEFPPADACRSILGMDGQIELGMLEVDSATGVSVV